MAEDLNLKITAKGDKAAEDLRKLTRSIKELSAEGIKMSKVFQGFDMSKSFGSAMGTKALLALSKNMKELRGQSEDTGRALKGIVARDIATYEKALAGAGKEVERLTERVLTFEKAAKKGMDGATEELNRYSEALKKADAEYHSLFDATAQLKGGQKQRFGGMTAFDAMNVGAGTAGAIGSAANTFQNLKTMEWGNLAGIRGPERNMLNQFMGGDFSTAYFMNKRGRNGKSWANDAMDQFGGKTLANLGMAAGAVGGAFDFAGGAMMLGGGAAGMSGNGAGVAGANATGGLGQMGGIGRISSGISSIAANLTVPGGPRAAEAGSFGQGIEYMKAANPMESAALQFIQQTAGMRVGAAKSLQGRHMESWGMGSGYGLDMGQSFNRANQMMAISGDIDWALGTVGKGGVSRSTANDNFTKKNRQKYAEMNSMLNNADAQSAEGLANLRARSAYGWGESGESPGGVGGTGFISFKNKDYLSAKTGLRMAGKVYDAYDKLEAERADYVNKNARGGPRSKNLFNMSSDMEQRGWSAEGAGQIFQRMGEGTGSLDKGERELKEVMAYAMENGFKKSKMHEMIADAISQRKVGASGEMHNFAEYAKMMYGGLDAKSNMRDVRANIGGMNVMDSFTNNQTFNLQKGAIAARAMGGRGSGGQMMALMNASYADLAGKSGTLEQYGISDDVRRKTFKEGLSMNLGSMGNMNDPNLKFLSQAMKGSGGDIFGAMKGVKAGEGREKDFGAFISAHYKGATMEEGRGLGRALGAYGEAGPEGDKAQAIIEKFMQKHGDGIAQATVATAQQQLMKAYKEETKIRNEYLDSLRKSLLTTDAIADNSAGFDAFTNFATMLVNIMNMSQGQQVQSEQVAEYIHGQKRFSSAKDKP